LWFEFARIIGEIKPPHVFIENSPLLRSRGLVTVLQNLAALGYDARWGVLSAADVGAPHVRKRIWIAADTDNGIKRTFSQHAEVASARSTQAVIWPSSDILSGVDDGLANRLDRVRATGNGQVSAVARLAWLTLTSNNVDEE